MIESPEFQHRPLDRLASFLPSPLQALEGTRGGPIDLPDNIVCFSRRSAAELNRPEQGRAIHHRFVLILALETAVTVTVDQRAIRLRRDEGVLVLPFQFHDYMEAENEDLCWLFVTFDMAESERLQELRYRPFVISPQVRESCVQLVETYLKGGSGELTSLLLAVLLQRIRSAETVLKQRSPLASSPRLVMQVNRLAHRRSHSLSVKELAGSLGVSSSHLRARFKASCGESVGRHLRRLRLEKACGLLRLSHRRVTEIAELCSFSSIYSFCRTFNNAYGVSPLQYRRAAGRTGKRKTAMLAPLICGAIGVLGSVHARASTQLLDVMPVPSQARMVEGQVAIDGPLAIKASVDGREDSRLAAACARALIRWNARLGTKAGRPIPVSIRCKEPGRPIPGLDENETYVLDVSAAGAEIDAPTVLGAIHGLETLLQLPRRGNLGWNIPFVRISDAPRFPWRGLMIDVARHWEPLEVILRNLDAMAVVKLNVLHLHLTDDQGFRIESRTHPELQAEASDGLFFTQDQMREIIGYAAARGIRVIPEFDVPGHSTSWLVSHPEIASAPGPYGIERYWGVFDPVLDPTNEATYALLSDVLGEMATLFPDPFIHIGGDENNGVQWNANPRIQAFIRSHNLSGNAGLHTYFNSRLVDILVRYHKRVVGWDEILQPGLPKLSVIDSWRGADALAAAARQGYEGILANGYYIDLMYHAADHYAADPIPAGSPLSDAQRREVLGGETTMWGEWVTPETIDSRIWPRAAAVAERLWSPQEVTDVSDMYRRLGLVSDRLEEAGSRHLRNRDLMLRHLVGENLQAPGVDALRMFLSVIEPIKGYQHGRGMVQTWVNQRVPLDGIADATMPESDAARIFNNAVMQIVFGPKGFDRAAGAALEARLREWQEAGRQVAEVLSKKYPALREAVAGSEALESACGAGRSALEALTSGSRFSESDATSCKDTLKRAAEPNLSATEIAILPGVRFLVAAAEHIADRAGESEAVWRKTITEASSPDRN